MKALFSFLSVCLLAQSSLFAQADTAHHRKVYNRINDNLKALAKIKGNYAEDEALTFSLEAWKEEGKIVRIDSKVPGEDGDGSEEYYLEDGKVLFAFRYYRAMGADEGSKPVLVEDRFYFKDGMMFKWIGTDKRLVDREAPEFTLEAERITSNAASFQAALEKGTAPIGSGRATTGTFKGIEMGDFGHWRLADETGKEYSFFILQPDESVDEVLENPEGFVGKPCVVRWKQSKEEISEGGGQIEVKQILSVKWRE